MLTKSAKTTVDKQHIESLIQSSFTELDLYEDFLLDEVGVVITARPGKAKPNHRWGILALGDGTTLTYLYGSKTAVCRYQLDTDGRRVLIPVQDQLPKNTPVTLKRHRARPDDWAGVVVPWEPKHFANLVNGRSIYRMVQCEPKWGTLYRAGAKQPRIVKTLWEGDNLDGLRNRYPQQDWPVREVGAKPVHFEQRDKGAWKLCNDPR